MLCFSPFELENRKSEYGPDTTASFANWQRPTWRDNTFNYQQVSHQIQPKFNATLPPGNSLVLSNQGRPYAVDVLNLLNCTDGENPMKSGRTPESSPAITMPQSHHSNPALSSSLQSTLLQVPYNPNIFGRPSSGSTSQSHQVPVDVKATSKAAGKKRRDSTVSSARHREKRKKERKADKEKISDLEIRIRKITEERDHYKALTKRIPIEWIPPIASLMKNAKTYDR